MTRVHHAVDGRRQDAELAERTEPHAQQKGVKQTRDVGHGRQSERSVPPGLPFAKLPASLAAEPEETRATIVVETAGGGSILPAVLVCREGPC